MSSDLAHVGFMSDAPLRSGSATETLFHIIAALVLLALSLAAFVVSTPFGVMVCFSLTLGLTLARPAAIPVLVVCAFLFQNLIIASFTPLVTSDAAFDTLRGANFVILMSAYGAFLIATFQLRLRHMTQLRPWLLFALVLLGLITFYLGLGALRGNPRDAIVYFRNTITPLACFHIALVSAALYRVELTRSLSWLTGVAIGYGYCELFFTMDFLSLFSGDEYIKRQIVRQIDTGVWEKALQQTGFVLRNLSDVMTTSFFNTPLLGDIFPHVFRIAGPNFHSIAFAYALSIISTWLLFKGRRLLPLLALPLLLVIGSKGAMALLGFALAAKIGLRLAPARLVTLGLTVMTVGWIGLTIVIGNAGGDYHVLGFYAGLKGFLGDPLGQGLGIGGNLSTSTDLTLDWNLAQANGIADVPVESAVGVILYQMGIGSFVFFGFLIALALTCRRLFLTTGNQGFLFTFVTIIALSANAVLQEEAFYSPLALGLSLLLAGVQLGSYWKNQPS